jgi:putative phosphoesterase
MRIGVISDTHGYFDPQLPHLLLPVEKILHAGDVGTQPVMDELRAIAPLDAVRGNVDPFILGLPPVLQLTLGGIGIRMMHQITKPQSLLEDWAEVERRQGNRTEDCRRFLASFPEACRVVIFGHTHEPCAIVLGGRLFLNPGSAGKKRFTLPRCFAMLEIAPQSVRATFVGLEPHDEGLPGSAELSLGG